MTREIPLTQGYTAIVDDEDYERVIQFKWYAQTSKKKNVVYAARAISKKVARPGLNWLHRLVMDAPDGIQVDHIDGNGLNCTRSNMRFATHTQNVCNRGIFKNNKCGYKGVSKLKKGKKWVATIRVNSHTIHLGRFDTPELAFQAYKQAAIAHQGEFAKF